MKPPRRRGIYRKANSRTGELTGKWYSTAFHPKLQRNINVGCFNTEEEALAARLQYIETMAKMGVQFE